MAAVCVNSGSENEEIEEVRTKQFRRFDAVSDESDHYYRNNNRTNYKDNGGDCFTNASSGVHKKIMKEWKVLEKNLPESIYVRVYERRIDLLRAAMVGPAGTPYHDGLFFFDLAFPPDYPTRPPQVCYWSFGLRLNPNLYANGRVCLSLLNTWIGKRNEKWNPSESTVLQLLVSIQGLVLNEKPYFNEPGTGVFPGQSKKSMAYNENVFVLSCKTMVYLLRRPPKNFEDFVDSHFRDRAHGILTACNAYMDGRARVGHCTDDGSICSSSSSMISVSNNFKAVMKSWYPELVVAFSRTGASVESFVEQLRVEKETASSKQVRVNKKKKKKKKTASFRPLVIKKTKYGITKVIGEIKRILGLKKVGKSRLEMEVKSP
uniref:Putative ubiquitin-conjugating enzyme E2 39 n=1 Tax=Davidia involucrata TaxID=16924 RepID=A0A5B6YIM9_DAVIN